MPAGKGKPEPERAGGLSRDRILDAAVAMAEAEGLEAISMRRLAQALDVWPMALYRYFQDKDELLDAIVACTTDRVSRPEAGGSWRERMRQLLQGARESLGHDPAHLTRALVTPGMLRLSEEGMSILVDAGLAEEERPRAWRALLAYTVGFAAQDIGDDEEFDYGLGRLLDGLERVVSNRGG